MKKKSLILILSSALLVAAVVLGTYAFTMYTQEPLTNVFTYGNLDLELHETKIVDGEVTSETTMDGNTYDLKWDTAYEKNVDLVVKDGSEPCYAFIVMVNELANLESDQKQGTSATITTPPIPGYEPVANQITSNGWTVHQESADGYTKIYYRELQVAGTYNFMESFRTKESFDYDFTDINGNGKTPDITFTVYAIESEGISDKNEAWAILKNQFPILEQYE